MTHTGNMDELSPVPLYLRVHLFLYGILFILAGVLTSFAGAICHILVSGLHINGLASIEPPALWLGGILTLIGTLLVTIELGVLLPSRRRIARLAEGDGFEVTGVTAVLTAYNDEESIAASVADFLAHPIVRRVIVVSNNSKDRTYERAREAGAIVHNELRPGYGQCVHRCLTEASVYEDTECVALCEGDMTFRARDLTKLISYLPHAQIVNGTRIVEQLRAYHTQLSTFMYYGNFFVGKLIEAKHFGAGTFTDAGTTYKVIRRDTLLKLLPHLNPAVNLEFNAYFLDTSLERRFSLLECPITFHARVGVSKGGNVNNFRAVKVGLNMILGLIFGWKRRT
jgi:GT2 family glycosyltransferase